MKKSALISLAFLVLVIQPSFSKKPPPDQKFLPTINSENYIKSVEVTEVETPAHVLVDELGPLYPLTPKVQGTLPGGLGDLKDIISVIDDLIAIGKKIWPIIEKNRPVVTTDFKSLISVLPRLEGNRIEMDEMDSWSVPEAKSYKISFKNYFNSEVVGFTFTVLYQYNGSYQGNGKYLTSIKVLASDITASWGFNFSAKSELINIANVGSKANPVASAIFSVNYKSVGLLNEVQGSEAFYVDGNGNFKKMN